MSGRAVSLVWNRRTGRPRLPWRLVLGLVVLVALGLAVQVVVGLASPLAVDSLLALLAPGVPGTQVVQTLRTPVVVIGGAGVLVASAYLSGRFVDRRRFRDFGFRIDGSWWRDLGAGVAIGAAVTTGSFLVSLAAGWVVVTDTVYVALPGFGFWPWVGWSVLTYVAVGVSEEVLFRGYLLTNLAEGLTWFDRLGPRDTARCLGMGERCNREPGDAAERLRTSERCNREPGDAVGVAAACSSLAFGVAHAANPHAGLASAAGVTLVGVMLATGYVLTGELALPIGLHAAWNVVQGTVYGLPVSGTSHGVSLLVVERTGPAVVTGGAFGPEAGLTGVAAAVAGTGLVAARVRRREGRLRIDPSITTPERRGGDG